MNPFQYVCQLQSQSVTPAQEAIEKALLSLLDEKEMHEISVKELCARANVARSTFYTYYDVMDDCLIMLENRFLHEITVLNGDFMGEDKIGNLDLSFFEHTIQYNRTIKKCRGRFVSYLLT